MKVVLLNTSEHTGGAAIAANRLMKALIDIGIEAKTLTLNKQTDDENVVSIQSSFFKRQLALLNFLWERWVIFLHNRFSRENLFRVSIANTGFDISRHPLVKDADIIHIHWINQGFLSLRTLKKLASSGKPIVWTMHDMWPITGICHYSWGCEKFTNECGGCPLLHSQKHKDLSYRIFKEKKFIAQSGIHFVAVSSWLKNMSLQSVLTKNLKISVIPNVIDIQIFHPSNKTSARKNLSLPLDKKIVLMGALRIDDPVKGFVFLKEAMRLVYVKNQDAVLVLFGNTKQQDVLNNISFPIIQMGFIKDTSTIAQLYAAADVNIVPSYYETFGQTITESMACGCPSVTFNNSGQTDIIDHQINGYLAKYQDSEDLAKGILWCFDNYKLLSTEARKKVENSYSEDVVGKKYIRLYNSLIR